MQNQLTLDEAKKELSELKEKLHKGNFIWRLFTAGIFIIIACIILIKVKGSMKVYVFTSSFIAFGLLIGFNVIKIPLPYRYNQELYNRISYLEGFIEGHNK